MNLYSSKNNSLIAFCLSVLVLVALAFTFNFAGWRDSFLTAASPQTNVSKTLTITTTSLPNGAVGSKYSTTIQAIGGKDSYAWSISSGNLPAGLVLVTAVCIKSPCQVPVTISGTPTKFGTSTFIVQVTSGKLSATKTFSIVVNPATTVTYPKGGENMVGGDPMLIKWVPGVPVSIIEIVSTIGNYSFGIYGPKYGNSLPITTGEYTYTVSSTTPAGTYYVRITPADGNAQAVSRKFTINMINQPSITVLSPNGGELWQRGSSQYIRWQYSSLAPSPTSFFDVFLEIYYPSCTTSICPAYPYRSPYTIAKNVPGSNFSWTVGKVLDLDGTPSGGQYRVSVCRAGTTICDSGDLPFTITSSTMCEFPAPPTNCQYENINYNTCTYNLVCPTPLSPPL